MDHRSRSVAHGVAKSRRWPVTGVTRQKFGSKWTYYDGKTLHTSGSSRCPGEKICPICSHRSEHPTSLWFQSRAEALHAERLDRKQAAGEIRSWRRSRTILLVDAPRAVDRIRYKPDFDVWVTSDPKKDNPDERIEVKGGIAGISYSGKLKIRLYREAERRGEQPPLRVVDREGRDLFV